ncbi:MAG TPA: outer membrane beta-barrel protein [Candidatus Acidoferrales bacterium]|nr:outer membrane beta-barrel protein [Candidatus Acidoferrales bacterium]
MKAALILLMGAYAASAQNSDLGLLIGISGPSSQTVTGTQVKISGSVGASGQFNYAMQLKEGTAGRLYLELPLLIGARASGVEVSGAGVVVTGSVQTGLYFTPGVRFNFTLHPRVSLYAMGGVGLASFDENQTVINKGSVAVTTGWTTSFAGAFGGGLDFRLTRLISLRAELRDFVSRAGIGLTDGRNHPVFGFGMGFHW